MSKLIEQLKLHEGIRTHAYLCTDGKITVGVGRNLDEDGGLGLSVSEIEFLLANDIQRCRTELETFSWFDDLDEVRQDALINMCFNLGMTRLLGFKNALARMAEGKYQEAADEFLDSRWATQVGNRALDVAEMIRTGRYPT